jgi:hypothetical protein
VKNVAVSPLSCRSCGAVLALGTGRSARCSHCATETPVPDEYLEVQRAAREFAENLELARALYAEVGKPPGWLLRSLTAGVEGASRAGARAANTMLILLVHPAVSVPALTAASYALGYPVASLLLYAGVLRPVDLTRTYSTYIVLVVTALIVVALVGIPLVLIKRARELAPVRAAIHASLAAQPPEHSGGPSRCRECGAGLDVPPGALGAPCAYCRADNLVALPAQWVQHVRRTEFTHFMNIRSALDALRAAEARAHERYWQVVLSLLIVLPLVLVVGAILNALKIRF